MARIVYAGETAQRRPRVKRESHLSFIRRLPCLSCGESAPSQAAHIRFSSLAYHKRETGMGEKPSDAWTVPLCPRCHTDGPDAQHKSNERAFWEARGIDVLLIALLLNAHSGDVDTGVAIIKKYRKRGV